MRGIAGAARGAGAAILFLLVAVAAPAEAPHPDVSFARTRTVTLVGSGTDAPVEAAFAPDGSLWVVGETWSRHFPEVTGNEDHGPGPDALIVRFDPGTGEVLSLLRLGGSGSDVATAVAFDAAGDAFVGGFTASADFPFTAGPDPSAENGGHGFVARIAPDGRTVVWANAVGGSDFDSCADLVLLRGGDVLVCGTTSSLDFPVVRPFQAGRAGKDDGFVARLRGRDGSLVFASYLGGPESDHLTSLARSPTGEIAVGGNTRSAGLATPGSLQPSLGGGTDGLVVLLDPWGETPVAATYLGGEEYDTVAELAYDREGNLVVAGRTRSPDFFALPAPHDPSPWTTDEDGFVVRMAGDGSALLHGRLLGGTGIDRLASLAVGPDGTAWVTASSGSTDVPLVGPVDPLPSPHGDVLVAACPADGGEIPFSTLLGGSDEERAGVVAVAPDGAVWVAGATRSTDFPGEEPRKVFLPRPLDLFLVRLERRERAPPVPPAAPAASALSGYAVRLRWEAPADGEDGFVVYRRMDREFPALIGFVAVATVPAGVVEFMDESVEPDTPYSYAVQTVRDGAGSAASAPAEVRTPATLRLEVRRGRYSGWNGWIQGGFLRIRGTLSLDGAASDGTFDLREEGILWKSEEPYDVPMVRFRIDPADPGWLEKGGELAWRGGNRLRKPFRFDPRTGRFRMDLLWRSSGIWDEEPWALHVRVGNDAGSVEVPWVRRGRRGLRTR